jgi:hypothetical protein
VREVIDGERRFIAIDGSTADVGLDHAGVEHQGVDRRVAQPFADRGREGTHRVELRHVERDRLAVSCRPARTQDQLRVALLLHPLNGNRPESGSAAGHHRRWHAASLEIAESRQFQPYHGKNRGTRRHYRSGQVHSSSPTPS